jgi:hypothetical protein
VAGVYWVGGPKARTGPDEIDDEVERRQGDPSNPDGAVVGNLSDIAGAFVVLNDQVGGALGSWLTARNEAKLRKQPQQPLRHRQCRCTGIHQRVGYFYGAHLTKWKRSFGSVVQVGDVFYLRR